MPCTLPSSLAFQMLSCKWSRLNVFSSCVFQEQACFQMDCCISCTPDPYPRTPKFDDCLQRFLLLHFPDPHPLTTKLDAWGQCDFSNFLLCKNRFHTLHTSVAHCLLKPRWWRSSLKRTSWYCLASRLILCIPHEDRAPPDPDCWCCKKILWLKMHSGKISMFWDLPQIMQIKDVKPEQVKVGLRHCLAVWMFVHVPEKLFCSLGIHVVQSFNFVWVPFFYTSFPHMIGKVKFINVHSCPFSQFLCNFIFMNSFLILSVGSQVAVVIIKDIFNALHVR